MKKKKKKKKNVYTFLMKSNFICWNMLKTEKLLATVMQLIRKNSVCCLKSQAIFFHRVNVETGLTPTPLFVFVRYLRNPLLPFHDERAI